MTALQTTPAWASAPARLRRVLDGSLLRSAPRTALRRLLLDRALDFWLGELDGRLSLTESRARVLSVVDETHDVKTFELDPGAAWLRRGHLAGQWVPVDVEIDGVRVRRCYSISSAPGGDRVAITVKRVPGGRVSGFLHEHVRPGAIVGIGAPDGDFVLPRSAGTADGKLLLLGGGSGVTPLLSIVRELARQDRLSDVVFVQGARTAADVIFADELAALAREHAGLRVSVRLDDAPDARPLDDAALRALVPDFDQRETYLCGPAGMMDAVLAIYERAGAASRLRTERFVAAAPRVAIANDTRAPLPVSLRLSRSGRTVAGGPGTVLEQLERGGERPAFGCRMGICNSCRCRKQRGTVVNVNTGRVSSEADEEIRLCVSVAQTDLELAL